MGPGLTDPCIRRAPGLGNRSSPQNIGSETSCRREDQKPARSRPAPEIAIFLLLYNSSWHHTDKKVSLEAKNQCESQSSLKLFLLSLRIACSQWSFPPTWLRRVSNRLTTCSSKEELTTPWSC